MKIESFVPAVAVAGLVLAPVAAISGTRTADDLAAGESESTNTETVIRLCGKNAATDLGVEDDACEQDPATHLAAEIERPCNKIDLIDLDGTDEACDDDMTGAALAGGPAAGAAAAGGAAVAGAAAAGGGLGAAAMIIPAAAATTVGAGIAASDSVSSRGV